MSSDIFDPLASLRGNAVLPPPPLEQAAFDAAHAAMAAALPDGPAALLDAVESAWRRADRIFDAVRATPAFALGQQAAACRGGCGWCCHQGVGAATVVVLAIARALAERPTQRARLAGWRAGQPCAFLENGACAIYDIRPLKCRAIWHVDVRHCMAKYAGLPAAGTTSPAFQPEPKMIYEGALKAVALTLIKAGRACPGVEFIPALAAVADRPAEALRLWWQGGQPFPADSLLDWFPAPRPVKDSTRRRERKR